MNYKFIYLTFLCNLIFTQSFGVLRQVHAIQVGQKRVILFHDDHPVKETSDTQFQNFLRFLESYSAKQNVHIMVEQPENTYIEAQPNPTVLSHTLNYLRDNPLSNVTVENIEMRCNSHAAIVLLSYNGGKLKFPNIYKAGNSSCDLEFFTYEDIISEHAFWFNKLFMLTQKTDNVEQRELYLKTLSNSFYWYKKFRDLMAEYKINEKVYFFSKLVFLYKDNHFKKKMKIYLIEAFRDLLDLHILNSIRECDNENIILIVGAAHAERLCTLLAYGTNVKLIYSNPQGEKDYVLTEEEFSSVLNQIYFC